VEAPNPMTLRQFDVALEMLVNLEQESPTFFDRITSLRLGQLRRQRGVYTVHEHREQADYTLAQPLNVILAAIPRHKAVEVLDAVADAEHVEQHPEILPELERIDAEMEALALA
jgi:hypothetical protein